MARLSNPFSRAKTCLRADTHRQTPRTQRGSYFFLGALCAFARVIIFRLLFSLTSLALSFLPESFKKRKIEQLSGIQVHPGKALVVCDNIFNRFSRNHGKAGSKLAVDPARLLQLLHGVGPVIFSEKLDDLVLISLVTVKVHSVRQPAHKVHDGFSVSTNERASRERTGYGVLKVLFREIDEYRVTRFAGQQRKRRLDDRRLNVPAGQRGPALSLTADADDHDIFVWN